MVAFVVNYDVMSGIQLSHGITITKCTFKQLTLRET